MEWLLKLYIIGERRKAVHGESYHLANLPDLNSIGQRSADILHTSGVDPKKF